MIVSHVIVRRGAVGISFRRLPCILLQTPPVCTPRPAWRRRGGSPLPPPYPCRCALRDLHGFGTLAPMDTSSNEQLKALLSSIPSIPIPPQPQPIPPQPQPQPQPIPPQPIPPIL